MPKALQLVLNSTAKLEVAVALVQGQLVWVPEQSALESVQEAWVPLEPELEMPLPVEMMAAVRQWQHWLRRGQVPD